MHRTTKGKRDYDRRRRAAKRIAYGNAYRPDVGVLKRPKWRPGFDSDTRHYFHRMESTEDGQGVYVAACGIKADHLGGHRTRRPPVSHRCEECNAAEMATHGAGEPLPAEKGWDRPG